MYELAPVHHPREGLECSMKKNYLLPSAFDSELLFVDDSYSRSQYYVDVAISTCRMHHTNVDVCYRS